MKITEEFLYYIWQNKLFESSNLTDSQKNKIEIISPGKRNTDSGPDFFMAKIKTDDAVLVGNVEIHVNSSDWHKHKHSDDKAYQNIILHVVAENDREIINSEGKIIPALVLKFDNSHFERYKYLVTKDIAVPCGDFLHQIDNFTVKSWLTVQFYERLENKTQSIRTLLEQTSGSKEEAFYRLTASAFGLKVNSQPFEMLAKSLPLNILAKHKNSLFQLESLLFGQSGLLLDNENCDEYCSALKNEYTFLQKKYSLLPIDKAFWKFMRMRPANFPTIRISQFANLIFLSSHLYSKIIETETIELLYAFFDVKASEYWDTHYTFGKISNCKVKIFGKEAAKSLIINTVIPVLFVFGKDSNNEQISERALFFSEQISPEKNNITQEWAKAGIKADNAFYSQALINLYSKYCKEKRCLECRIGNKII